MHYPNIPDEELKSRVGEDYFSDFDHATKIGKIDFCIQPKKIPGQTEPFAEVSLLWAEAKRNKRDIIEMFAQLILTIGKARTFNQHLSPAFLGVFDAEKIAFVPYEKVSDLFYKNDFNWNVAPSNQNTKEFAEIKSLINDVLEREKYLYAFGKDDKNLRFFIKNNLAKGTENNKIKITKNNFTWIFEDWLKVVKPLITPDFTKDKKQRILESNFYLADLFVDDRDTTTIDDDVSVNENLFVVFRNGQYEIDPEKVKRFSNELGVYSGMIFKIKGKTAYENFWKRYKRPPLKDSQDYILDRRDLLTPQDFRERKGAFFTPKQWVQLSQQYIADVLGEDWQDEYYVWDCCAGSGNLLRGLTNKYHIYASTLDQGDVEEMKGKAKENKANLLETHIFQFDFLNDDFFDTTQDFYDADGKKIKTDFLPSKLPQSLQNIIKDPEKRKKLVVYINPPYVEGDSAVGRGRKGVQHSRVHLRYQAMMGRASGELFAQFLIRIYCEIPNSVLANFSTLKILQAPNFSDFREKFRAKLEKAFLVPADTFDNVNGQFPIGFFIWDTKKEEFFREIPADMYDSGGIFLERKKLVSNDGKKYISDWLAEHSKNIETEPIGNLASVGNDFQNQRMVFIESVEAKRKIGGRHTLIYSENLLVVSIYFAVRHCIAKNWKNNQDQFLYPKETWKTDREFHYDCLVFTLFNINIKSKYGSNHWIPFTETEVNAQERFASNFMSDFIAGKIKKTKGNGDLFNKPKVENGTKCKFSPEAQAVFNAGRELWRYYHSQKQDITVNASLYDIREHFQGRNEKGKMNSKSSDEKYTELIGILREKLKTLADKIAEKVYLHAFLQ